jgi:hypothetical protein
VTPVERLTAAIEKLEALKADSTPGPWWHWPEAGVIEIYSDWRDPARTGSEVVIAPRIRPRDGWGREATIYRDNYEPNAELIVTLHRTIDAQLAILRRALDVATPIDGQASYDIGPGSRVGQALALADAILGDQS